MPRLVGTILQDGLPQIFRSRFSFVIVLAFVLTERSATVLVFVIVFVTKIALEGKPVNGRLMHVVKLVVVAREEGHIIRIRL